MRLIGRNFQPWSEFSMIIDGLTLIVGNSNKGKSSIFRALRGVLRNNLPAEFVRDGQDERMEVSLDVEGTPTIKATRTRKGTTKYEIGKDKYAALGSNVPEPMEALRFNEVRIGEASMDPIFSEQNKAQFLIDPDRYKPGELNAILGAFSSTEKLDTGKKEANLRITQRNSEARTLAEEIREAEERKELLANLSGKVIVVSSEVEDSEAKANRFESKAESLHEVVQRSDRLALLREIIGAFSLPDISEAAVLEKKTGHLFQAAFRLVRHRLLTDIGFSIDDALVRWESIAKVYKRQRETAALLEMVGREGTSPKEYAEQLGSVLRSVEGMLASTFGCLTLGKAIASTQALTVSIAKKGIELEEAERTFAEMNLELSRLNGVYEETKAAAKAKEGPKCPKCGGNLRCPACQPSENRY